MFNSEPIHPVSGFLEDLRKITSENDILLIFDEVITGFRLALGGAQEYFQVYPDLSVFAKAVAGGYPLAGIAGKMDIMQSGVHPAGTFNANPISVVAALATIEELEKDGTYTKMADITSALVDGVKKLSQARHLDLFCDSIGSVWQIEFGITDLIFQVRLLLTSSHSLLMAARTKITVISTVYIILIHTITVITIQMIQWSGSPSIRVTALMSQ